MLKDKIKGALDFLTVSAAVLVVCSPMICADGACGSRGTYPVRNFQYHGASAAVMANDVRFGMDTYFLQVNGKDKIEDGSLTADDGKVYEVREDGRRYFISEK